jgi:2-octaprenylphenol hydroxylase
MQKYDVLVVGAGMVGLAFAVALAKHTRLSIAIVDTLPQQPLSQAPELRVSAINHASQRLFKNLDVWPLINQQRLASYQYMHVWEQATQAHFSFQRELVPQPSAERNLGWIIENTVIRNALYDQAVQQDNIHFINHKLATITQGDQEVFAVFEHQSIAPVFAKLVIGADGANSWLRQQQKIPLTFRDYDHHAIVATVHCEQGHQQTAWQVFLSTGPLAFLPLSDPNLCSIVWSTSPQQAKQLQQCSIDEFNKQITAASDGKLGRVSLQSELVCFPLTMRLAQQFVKDKVVLIGDAAHTIHPLAGQGVNLGLQDAAALAQTLTELYQQQLPLNQTKALQAFQRWRKADAVTMIAAMESIKQLYSPLPTPIEFIRGVAMRAFEQCTPLKALCVRQALGDNSTLPLLMQ